MVRNNFSKLLFTILLISAAFANAQSLEVPTKEFVIRLVSLNNIDFVYKKETRPNKIRRFRIMFTQVDLATGSNNTTVNFNTGFAYGIERRKDLGKSTYFMSGWEPYAVANYNSNKKVGIGRINLGLGYLVGFGHNFTEHLGVGIEVIPSVYTSFSVGAGSKLKPFTMNANFNASSIAASFIYRIN
jgi:hypothetical protein